jgi:hypothetical protein
MNAVKFRVGDDARIKTRTEVYNKLLVTIDEISEEKEWHSKRKATQQHGFVPGTGIEPAHPCEYQILSLARLPIPPSGLKKGTQYYNFEVLQPKYGSDFSTQGAVREVAINHLTNCNILG